MKVLIVYILSMFLYQISGFVIVLFMPLVKLVRHHKSLFVPTTVFINMATTFIGVLIVVAVCSYLEYKPSCLLWVIALLLTVSKDMKRIKYARLGKSRTAILLKNAGQSYDNLLDIRTEKSAMAGNVFSLIIGLFLFFNNGQLV